MNVDRVRKGWLRLLLCHERRNGQGLTIPFLIGALRDPVGDICDNEALNTRELRSLLESMRDDTPEGRWVRIAECGDLQQPVAYPKTDHYHPMQADTVVFSPSHARESLVVQSTYLTNPECDIEALVDYLWKRSSAAILKGMFSFSRSRSEFCNFSDADLAFIQIALADPEDVLDEC